MDASAYLQRHGWTGGGLGYKQSGIKKPILASQKHGFQKGLGGKPLGGHSDQWWLGAFDAGLKSLGSDKPAAAPPVIAKGPAFFKAELYRNFVQGEGLTGTLAEQLSSTSSSKNSSSADEVASSKEGKIHRKAGSSKEKREKKRKRGDGEERKDGDSDDEARKVRRKIRAEKRARKEERRLRRAQREAD